MRLIIFESVFIHNLCTCRFLLSRETISHDFQGCFIIISMCFISRTTLIRPSYGNNQNIENWSVSKSILDLKWTPLSRKRMAFFLHAKSILSFKAYFDLFHIVFGSFFSMNFESGFRFFRQSIQKVNSSANAVNLDFEYSIHFFISILVFEQLKTV